MEFVVPATQAAPLRRTPGTNITIVNQSGVDVYFETTSTPAGLNSTVTGAVPRGTKVAANGGQIQFGSFPGLVWFRGISDTEVRIEP